MNSIIAEVFRSKYCSWTFGDVYMCLCYVNESIQDDNIICLKISEYTYTLFFGGK